jgi:hypothetical protein
VTHPFAKGAKGRPPSRQYLTVKSEDGMLSVLCGRQEEMGANRCATRQPWTSATGVGEAWEEAAICQLAGPGMAR